LKENDFAYLIISRELYRIYISTEELRRNSFNKIARIIEDLEVKLGGFKIISEFDQMEAFTKKFTNERKLDPLRKEQFAERTQILNIALYHRQGVEEVLVRSSVPQFTERDTDVPEFLQATDSTQKPIRKPDKVLLHRSADKLDVNSQRNIHF
jgi:hypothetical protein